MLPSPVHELRQVNATSRTVSLGLCVEFQRLQPMGANICFIDYWPRTRQEVSLSPTSVP